MDTKVVRLFLKVYLIITNRFSKMPSFASQTKLSTAKDLME